MTALKYYGGEKSQKKKKKTRKPCQPRIRHPIEQLGDKVLTLGLQLPHSLLGTWLGVQGLVNDLQLTSL